MINEIRDKDSIQTITQGLQVKYSDFFYKKGILNMRLKRPFDAIVDFSAACSNDPSNPSYYNLLG